MMTIDQLVSITDLKKNTTKVFKLLLKWPKFIVVNNRMQWVILSTTDYEYLKLQEFNEDMEEALQNSKTYDNVEDLFRDALSD